MSYKIYTDKNENFECEVFVKNASLKGSIARLIVESNEGPTLVFNGKLDGEKCIIPIKRLKGLLDENARGNMHLEVIVEDTYFTPWKSDFIVEEHTSVKVKMDEQKQSSNKPIVEVKSVVQNDIKKSLIPKKLISRSPKGINVIIPIREISTLCEQFGIRKNNFHKKRSDFFQLLKEYFNFNTEYKNHIKTILTNIDDILS
jgi:hypothetical protein